MKPNLVSLVTILAGAALLSFGLCRWTRCATPESLDVLDNVSWLSSTLGLSHQQAADIRTLQKDFTTQLEQCDSMHCRARCQLAEILFAGTNDSDRAERLIDDMCAAQARSERATIHHMQAVYRLLSPKQQKRYQNLVAGCVCSSCAHSSMAPAD